MLTSVKELKLQNFFFKVLNVLQHFQQHGKKKAEINKTGINREMQQNKFGGISYSSQLLYVLKCELVCTSK